MHKHKTLPKPEPCIGLGLRHLHYDQALNHQVEDAPIDFVEIHAENFFAKGGITRALLDDVQNKYSLSVHGTSLGLGSQMALPQDTLAQFVELVNRTQPMLVSEHLCFNRAMVGNKIYHSGDLLPIAYNDASLMQIVGNIQQLQDAIKRPILIENLSAYMLPSDIDESSADTMQEFEFLVSMCEQAGCGLLLDLNNLLVNALNQKSPEVLDSAFAKIKTLPAHLVGEIHLAGFSERQVAGFIIDDHGQAVSEQCWQLYAQVVKHLGHVPTLVEWDTNLPEWQVLVKQTQIARSIAIGA
ncbi:DUF692 family multinuclear iron-containing protein [Glaciecola sp. SC05]|uniref:DUF692 domain-containing protein n=1 Tax=Glaciecola sp. SC05 TaxID=1987355 RepID=UPI003527197E